MAFKFRKQQDRNNRHETKGVKPGSARQAWRSVWAKVCPETLPQCHWQEGHPETSYLFSLLTSKPREHGRPPSSTALPRQKEAGVALSSFMEFLKCMISPFYKTDILLKLGNHKLTFEPKISLETNFSTTLGKEETRNRRPAIFSQSSKHKRARENCLLSHHRPILNFP